MADADARKTSEQGAEARPVAHDDIMRRLLEYQRQLREGVPPSEAAKAVAESDPSALRAEPPRETATATTEETVVDLTRAEAELEAEVAQAEPELAGASEEPVTPPEAGIPVSGEGAPVATPSAEATPSPAAPTEPAGGAEPHPVWATPAPDPALTARVERLERTLEQVATQVSDLRQRFQDLAIAADERLAELERTLARAREG